MPQPWPVGWPFGEPIDSQELKLPKFASGSISANGNLWAMTYTPYNNDGTCKSTSQVASDMATVKAKGFTTVRTYATDCNGPQNIGAAAQSLGLKVILGIYIDGSGIGSATSEQVSDLTSWGADN